VADFSGVIPKLDERPDRRDLKPEARQMKTPRLFLCEGFCRLTGPIRDTIEAAGFGDARTKFFIKHRVSATHITPTKL
jgi:hypothetical protein